MKKKAILTLLVLGVTSIALTGCNKNDDDNGINQEDLNAAEEFLLDIDYNSVSWDAFEYTYEWANLTNYAGEAMTRDLQLTEKNFYPYGSQTEIWYDVLENEPTHPQESTFYYTDGYGFEPDTGLAWTYGDTYDDALDYYFTDIDLQIAWEYSEGYDFLTNVELEYTDDVVTGVTFYHHSVTEGVGVVDDYFTYRTDTNHVLTQYIYETLTTIDQEYEGVDTHVAIYAKHNLRKIDASTIYVPDFDPDDYNIEGVEPGYDVEVPTMPGHGEAVSTETLTEEQAKIYLATDLDAIDDWTGYAYDWPSLSEGGYEQIEYITEKDGHPYGIVEEYLGNPGGEGTLTEGLYYDGTGYQYEYGPASSGEGADVGSATLTTDTYSSLLEEKLYKLGNDGFFGQLNSALTGINKDYYQLTATRTTYQDGTIGVDIDYKADFSNPDWETVDWQDYNVVYYFDTNLKLIGISVFSENYSEYAGTVQSHGGYNHILYEINEGNVTAVLPEWVSNF